MTTTVTDLFTSGNHPASVEDTAPATLDQVPGNEPAVQIPASWDGMPNPARTAPFVQIPARWFEMPWQYVAAAAQVLAALPFEDGNAVDVQLSHGELAELWDVSSENTVADRLDQFAAHGITTGRFLHARSFKMTGNRRQGLTYRLPKWVGENASAAGVVVWLGLASFADWRAAGYGECWPTNAQLSARTGAGLGTIRNGMKDLEKLGALEKVAHPGKSSVCRLWTTNPADRRPSTPPHEIAGDPLTKSRVSSTLTVSPKSVQKPQSVHPPVFCENTFAVDAEIGSTGTVGIAAVEVDQPQPARFVAPPKPRTPEWADLAHAMFRATGPGDNRRGSNWHMTRWLVAYLDTTDLVTADEVSTLLEDHSAGCRDGYRDQAASSTRLLDDLAGIAFGSFGPGLSHDLFTLAEGFDDWLAERCPSLDRVLMNARRSTRPRSSEPVDELGLIIAQDSIPIPPAPPRFRQPEPRDEPCPHDCLEGADMYYSGDVMVRCPLHHPQGQKGQVSV